MTVRIILIRILAVAIMIGPSLAHGSPACLTETEALGTIANDQTIEILIADATMPGLEGSNLAARAWRILPELKVLLMSGGEADGRGIPLLRKPFTEHDLRRFMAETT